MSKLPARPAQNRSPMSQALADGCQIAAALRLVEEMTEARKQLYGSQNERDFFGALDAAGLACASAALLAAATEQIEPMAMGLMLTMVYDAVPAAARIDVEQIVHAILALVGVEESTNLRWSMRSRDPDGIGRDEKILELRGYSQTVVSRAIRNLLTECKFAPAPSEVLTALSCARSNLAHRHIEAEQLLAERARIIAYDRKCAEFERKLAAGEIEPLPPPPDQSVERERRIAADKVEAARWRKIIDGELNPFAHLLEETSSLETPMAESLDDDREDGEVFDDDPEARATERGR